MIYQIGSKQAYIVGNVGVSYNTPIAASAAGVTFITSRYYSNTTAHHKSDFIRYFNNSQTVEVSQAALIDIINQDLDPAAVIQEQDIKTGIINRINAGTWLYADKRAAKYLEVINQDRKNFKNGNFQTIRTFKTSFKYVSNFRIKETSHAFRTKRPAYNGPTGPKPEAYYYKYKTRSVLNY